MEPKLGTEEYIAAKATAPRVTQADVDALLKRVKVVTQTQTTPTKHILATAWLDDSFYLGCATNKAINPENFDEVLGVHYATQEVMAKATEALWSGLGMQLYLSQHATATTTAKERAYKELQDLKGRMDKLQVFLKKGKPETMSDAAWSLNKEQWDAMDNYYGILQTKYDLM